MTIEDYQWLCFALYWLGAYFFYGICVGPAAASHFGQLEVRSPKHKTVAVLAAIFWWLFVAWIVVKRRGISQ